jgi:L-threonylcarbamoyladenylate synthase
MQMQTQIKKADTLTADGQAAIAKAASYLRRGELVGFPTETVYGLGADAINSKAVARIFAAKGRPADNPLISHICSFEMGQSLAEFTPLAKVLADNFWPGPLTMVLKHKKNVPDILTAGLDTIALRWPAHPVAVALIKEADTPIAAPSANISGRPSPTTAAHVLQDMSGKIPFILDSGAVEIGLESTVVDARGKFPKLLRPGKITIEELETLCGKCLLPNLNDQESPASPGMKYRHYAPRGKVYLAEDSKEAMLIAARLATTPLFIVSEQLAQKLLLEGIEDMRIKAIFGQNCLEEYAKNLFAHLRAADDADEQHIVVEKVEDSGLGHAIMNRLKKAASE